MGTSGYDPTIHGGDEHPGWSTLATDDTLQGLYRVWLDTCGSDRRARQVWDATRHLQVTPATALEMLQDWRPIADPSYVDLVTARSESWFSEHRGGLLADALAYGIGVTWAYGLDQLTQACHDIASLLADHEAFTRAGPSVPWATGRVLAATVTDARPSVVRTVEAMRRREDVAQRRHWESAAASAP